VSPNIKPVKLPTPDATTPTWDHWHKFMADIVTHLETKYGVRVRNNWYRGRNEATWMYAEGAAGYNELYYNTTTGLLPGDPMIKVGGSADSGNSPYAIPSLIDYVRDRPHCEARLRRQTPLRHDTGRTPMRAAVNTDGTW
jgi:hypothetical protein